MKNKYFLVGFLAPVLITLLGIIVVNLGSYYINEVACSSVPNLKGITIYERMCAFAPTIYILGPASLLLIPSQMFLSIFGIKIYFLTEINSILWIMSSSVVLGIIFGIFLVILQKILNKVGSNENRKSNRHSR